ncbi:BTE binding protein-like protein 4 [Lindgomyces ingoldianus]|uniref:BTE binding protein-like protein 4 n=1 Tax=Lindgomyces ingoldianus TaxID=673940 RepID=A0ACB6RFH9_9PLEO|nr:BTE binding protein-like protein 4 [Lindgomyces ingoldianus]KAF2477961.1 BTE binding protein-like protein 4 [Lindgomyces ingoldianus]
MLSTNAPSSIQRRRTQHRRQNSTPAAFEAPQVRPLPANIQQKRQQRSGMSLDLRGLNLETINMPQQPGSFSERMTPSPMNMDSFQQEDSTVSITNIGQPQQHTMQVAQTHSQPRPGFQDTFMQSPVQTSLPSPRTPHRTLREQSPQQPPLSPSKPPTEQQLKELHQHIQSVYGSCGQVFINILPTPTATPQKPTQLPSHEPLDSAPMPPNFGDMTDINLQPTSSAMAFDFDNPDSEMGYESSSYYTSDALSPSPTSSPHQRTVQMFLENIEEYPHQEMDFSQAPSLLPSTSTSSHMTGLPLSATESMSQQSAFLELDVDASIEYTGISPEEVQRYISEQDPATNKWTCLYPECGKTFGRRENIRSHVQTHLGDRQFRCNGCGKCFVRQHDLKRHAKIHTGNKPYKCPCGAGFARQDALTRHRQRGMCVGGFADAVRRQAKRGRPKKNRPGMEDRAKKANRTRRALASTASSVSAGSPQSDGYSTRHSPPPLEEFNALQTSGLPKLLSDISNFGDPMSSSADPFSFETASSPFVDSSQVKTESFTSSGSFAGDEVSMNLLHQLSGTTHTPPMSPEDQRPNSAGSVSDTKAAAQQTSNKGSATPSRSSIQSNPFSTPPTSPVEPKNDLDELFNSLPESSCSQFDLEMKALGEFTSFDSTPYELLDFNDM